MRVQAGCQGVRGKEVTERNSTIERVRKHRAALRAALEWLDKVADRDDWK
jgi:hypothetical protein